MSYTVTILAPAAKALDKLPRRVVERVRDAIRALGTNPRPPGCLKLGGRSGWRIRVGEYRVIYEIDDPKRRVRVTGIGNRRDVYR